jgi:hypothetical protein
MELPHPTTWNYWVLDEDHNVVCVDYDAYQQCLKGSHPLELEEKTIVGKTFFDGGRVEVSTVFTPKPTLPTEGKPWLLFETMIFRSGGRRNRTIEGERYATWQEAQEGHDRAVRAVEAELATKH